MSLVGFTPSNHPQQVGSRGAVDVVDDRWTPLNLWIPWDTEFGFTLDAAASNENYLCKRYYTIEEDGLKQSWVGERVWLNPPFSALEPWVAKAWSEIRAGCELVVMLAPGEPYGAAMVATAC